MTGPISRNRLLGSLTEAASWPGPDRNTKPSSPDPGATKDIPGA